MLLSKTLIFLLFMLVVILVLVMMMSDWVTVSVILINPAVDFCKCS